MAEPYHSSASVGASMPTTAKSSRINADVERVISLTQSVNNARNRLTNHSAAMGYFSDSPEAIDPNGKVQSISNNMQNALSDLDRAIERLHGALNLFD